MVSLTTAVVTLLAINIIYMTVIAFFVLDVIPEKINAAVSETRRNVYRACRGKEEMK